MSIVANILISSKGWEIGNFCFRRLKDKKKNRQEYYRASASLSKGNKVRKSILYKSNNKIHDILLLYNFFMRGNACLEESFNFYNRNISEGIVINDDKFYDAMKIALSVMRKRQWKAAHKDKILAFNWFLRSRVTDEMQIAFFNRWIPFELMGKYSNDIDSVLRTTVGAINYKMYRKFWRDMRHCIVHEGACEYASFRNALSRSYQGGGSRFTNTEKRFFNNNVRKKYFKEFQADSIFIMDIVLTLYFSYLFGITSLRNFFHGFYFDKLLEYDANLKLKQKEGLKIIFKSKKQENKK